MKNHGQDDSFIAVHRCLSREAAYSIKVVLENAEVPVFIEGENERSAIWGTWPLFGGVRILVPVRDQSKARAILDRHLKKQPSPSAKSRRRKAPATSTRPWVRPFVGLYHWLINPKLLVTTIRSHALFVTIALALFLISAAIGFWVRPAFMQRQWNAVLAELRAPGKPYAFEYDDMMIDLEPLMQQIKPHLKPSDSEADKEDPSDLSERRIINRLLYGQMIIVPFFALLVIVTGFILGLYPIYILAVWGLWSGFCMHRWCAEGVAVGVGHGVLNLPILLSMGVTLILASAMGLRMGTFIVRKRKGVWFKTQLWQGIVSWAKVMLPLLLLGCLLQIALAYVLAMM